MSSDNLNLDLIKEYVDKIYTELEQSEKLFLNEESLKLLNRLTDANPDIVKLFLILIKECIKGGESEFRLSPRRNYTDFMVMRENTFRTKLEVPKTIYVELIKMILKLSNIKNLKKPVEGEFYLTTQASDYDVLVNFFPTIFGPSLLVHLRTHDDDIIELDQLGFNKDDLNLIIRTIKRNSGLFIVSGPKGSGKTSIIYAILKHLKLTKDCIMTAEEPVKKIINGLNQSQINSEKGYSEINALRGMIRHKADVIYLSHADDDEVQEELMKASLAGRLCFTSISARNVMATIQQLLDSTVPDSIIVESLSMILALRVIRKNCSKCRVEYIPDETLLTLYDLTTESLNFRKGEGCEHCNNTGYKGITLLYEILPWDEKLRKAIRNGLGGEELQNIAEDVGFCSFYDTAQYLFFDGTITIEDFHEAIKMV